MENKKLLKYILNDLTELDEMFAEKGKNSFDDVEIEFIQNRISGAIKLVRLYLEHESDAQEVKLTSLAPPKVEIQQEVTQKTYPGNRWVEETTVVKTEEKEHVVAVELKEEKVISEKIEPEIKTENKATETELNNVAQLVEKSEKTVVTEKEPDKTVKKSTNGELLQKLPFEDNSGQPVIAKSKVAEQELHLEEEPEDVQNKRLGDLFPKEKSVNDIMADDSSKLEQKISNRPVASIQAAIGINDKFQYIRELFEGSADNFVKTVADLDSMNDMKEAVDYLQANFKWKKNDTSLKFVNLIKRRFSHE